MGILFSKRRNRTGKSWYYGGGGGYYDNGNDYNYDGGDYGGGGGDLGEVDVGVRGERVGVWRWGGECEYG